LNLKCLAENNLAHYTTGAFSLAIKLPSKNHSKPFQFQLSI